MAQATNGAEDNWLRFPDEWETTGFSNSNTYSNLSGDLTERDVFSTIPFAGRVLTGI
jgi:hypothetical protein